MDHVTLYSFGVLRVPQFLAEVNSANLEDASNASFLLFLEALSEPFSTSNASVDP